MNLILNHDFGGGWTDQLPVGALTNQQPAGFALYIRRPGVRLVSAGADVPDEAPVFNTVVTIPECVHKHATQLPENERLGAPDALVLAGEYTFKVFSSVNPYSVDLTTWAMAPADGRLAITVPVTVHAHGDPSIGAAVWRVLVDGHAYDWLTFQRDYQPRAWVWFGTALDVDAGQVVEITLQMESRALGGIDFFTDNWRAEFTPSAQPITECPVTECKGAPREDYTRTLHVIPGYATDARRAEIAQIAVVQRKQSCGPSYDDAGIGDLADKTAVLWDIPEVERSEYVEFYEDYYPGTKVVFEGDGGAVVPPVVPPGGGEPTPYVLRSKNLIGLHSGFVRAKTWEYIETAAPTVQKFFSAGDCYLAKLRAPEIITVWRKFVSSLPSNDAQGGARWYVDQYSAEIEDAARALGISTAQLLSGIDAAESYNEMIPTHNLDALKWAVEFDCAFAESLSTIDIVPVLPVLLNGAVGNPHETEVELMLPAAQAAEAYGGFVGYHTYWAANRTDTYIRSGWQYHAGRWMEWDKIFTAHGVYPRYLSTESGICYAPDGWSFDPSSGWKACGSFERYLLDINEYNRRCLEWNASHANRFAGMTLFGYGNWGWDSFELGDGEVLLLERWASGAPVTAQAVRPAVADTPSYREQLRQYLNSATYISAEHRAALEKAL